ncbi:MAG: transposase [Chloroflexota bacterium]
MNPLALIPGKYYHIYNRGNNRENLFIEERNYHYFMKCYAHHIEPVAQTYAYCLLRNHFHFLVCIKDDPLPKPPSQAFSNLFNAYAQAFNKMYDRTGALFQRPFGRIRIDSDEYFRVLVVYIHQNPQKHGFVDDFHHWPFSSIHALVSTRPTHLQRETVIDWFGNLDNLTESHSFPIEENQIAALIRDDFD